MMRAFAVLTTGAVALIALPVSAGASDQASEPVAVAGSTAESFLDRTAVLGLPMGLALWLSVALVALMVATVLLKRSRRGSVPVDTTVLTDVESPLPVQRTSGLHVVDAMPAAR